MPDRPSLGIPYVNPYFKDNRRYAETFSDVWLILSAKYGFLKPSFVIPGAYEVTFKRPSTRPISTAVLAIQVYERQLTKYDLVEVLGDSDCAERVRAAFAGGSVRIACPIEGLRLGGLAPREARAAIRPAAD